ncbi:hypothetical protein [Agarivorans sp. QJM3NY_33]|uniref:hypothetical protein n=1 Tax=Agarivorans sp. QJM3NY_33 TaxID=3421432 RepID=UPI003D7CD2E7
MHTVTNKDMKQCGCKGEAHDHQPEHQHECQCQQEGGEHTAEHQCGCTSGQGETQFEALDMAMLGNLVQRLADPATFEQKLSCFTKHHPGVRVIVCSEDDMAEREPFMACEHFDIFLMANGMGCARITDSIELAIGVIIAMHEE